MIKKFLRAVLCYAFLLATMMPLSYASNNAVSVTNNFSTALEKATVSVNDHLDTAPTDASKAGAVRRIIEKTAAVIFPVLVIVAVLLTMVGLYTVLSDPGKIKEGMQMIMNGIIGIILLFSARYLSYVIFNNLFGTGQGGEIIVADLLKNLYSQMVYPFLKLAIYFALGILVLIMMSRVFTYITAQDDKVKTKAMGVFTWTTAGMLIITGAKQIVEAIYGKQETVLATKVSNLQGIGTQILNPKSIPILFQVMNWALGLISFVLLVMILWQTYQMLTKPDDESVFKSLKNTIMYAFGGLVLIGSAYLLANRLIIT